MVDGWADWLLGEQSIDVMHEWAAGLNISDDNVERERQIIMEEWRSSRTGQGR